MRDILLAVFGATVMIGSSVQAHHSYTGFYPPTERTVTVEGQLESFLYANPHVVMKIRTSDSTVYTVTWQAATWVDRRAGVKKTTFNIGDHVVVIGAPSRDPQSREVTQVREVRRPRDNWEWRDAAPFAKPF